MSSRGQVVSINNTRRDPLTINPFEGNGWLFASNFHVVCSHKLSASGVTESAGAAASWAKAGVTAARPQQAQRDKNLRLSNMLISRFQG
jgi:hypothetical protein